MVAGLDRSRLRATDVLARPAHDGRHRRLPPEQLLDRARDDVGVVDDAAAVLRVLREEREEARERIGDGVQPGGEEHEADRRATSRA